MSEKDLKAIERIIRKVLNELMDQEEMQVIMHDTETDIPISIIDKLEDYMGEPIRFMAIS